MSNQLADTLTESTARSPTVADRSFAQWLWRLAKDVLFFVYLHGGYVQLRDALRSLMGRSRVVVLYYHRVGGSDVLTKPLIVFRNELEYLKKNYECIGLADLCARLRSKRPFRRRAAVITFDDGYRDNFTVAFPALKEAELTATFFVATGFIGTRREFPHDLGEHVEGPPDSRHFPKLTWDDLRAMQQAGFEIGSHTINHTSLGQADSEIITQEVRGSLDALNQHLGQAPRPFSFPWGKRVDISERAIEEVKRAGYYAAASACGGANGRGSETFAIKRIDVGNGRMSKLAVRARIAGLDTEYGRTEKSKKAIVERNRDEVED